MIAVDGERRTVLPRPGKSVQMRHGGEGVLRGTLGLERCIIGMEKGRTGATKPGDLGLRRLGDCKFVCFGSLARGLHGLVPVCIDAIMRKRYFNDWGNIDQVYDKKHSS